MRFREWDVQHDRWVNADGCGRGELAHAKTGNRVTYEWAEPPQEAVARNQALARMKALVLGDPRVLSGNVA